MSQSRDDQREANRKAAHKCCMKKSEEDTQLQSTFESLAKQQRDLDAEYRCLQNFCLGRKLEILRACEFFDQLLFSPITTPASWPGHQQVICRANVGTHAAILCVRLSFNPALSNYPHERDTKLPALLIIYAAISHRSSSCNASSTCGLREPLHHVRLFDAAVRELYFPTQLASSVCNCVVHPSGRQGCLRYHLPCVAQVPLHNTAPSRLRRKSELVPWGLVQIRKIRAKLETNTTGSSFLFEFSGCPRSGPHTPRLAKATSVPFRLIDKPSSRVRVHMRNQFSSGTRRNSNNSISP
ncbi:uncharacterized protein BDZ99DRAFT_500693 [Mytilinidion resinicola]|uniref:BZIP domain-containing protein n=1 Tax=Mytilinidion resinicola TaxID=574789 RepID=A0A6A6YG27_9PEZI|nr:uncharacterized protein BDZ99DRAFT_500693 [Mytilinidion resinicola]KAF2807549.1 hypothetical protein BDZ99DRAFT_500693 [Mytilinidion resinicola]